MDKTKTKMELRALLLVFALVFCFCVPSLSAWASVDSTPTQSVPEAESEAESDLGELEVPHFSILISFVSRYVGISEPCWCGTLIDNRIPRPPESLA